MTPVLRSNDDLKELKDQLFEKIAKPVARWVGRQLLNLELAPQSEQKMTFEEAQMYILFCNHNNHKDWRLPTRLEWETIHGYDTQIWLKAADNVVWDRQWYVQPIRDKK